MDGINMITKEANADSILVFARIGDKLHQVILDKEQQDWVHGLLKYLFPRKPIPVITEEFCYVKVVKNE